MVSRFVIRYVRNLKNGRAQRRRLLRSTLPKLGSRVLTVAEGRKLEKARAARTRIRRRRERRVEPRAAGLERAANYTNLTTWFKAQGTTVSGNDYHGRLPASLSHGPVRFVSREGVILGRVKFNGYRSVDELVGLLDRRLRYEDASGRSISFTEACIGWAYKWRLYGMPPGSKKSVLIDSVDRRGGQRIRDLFTEWRRD